MRRGVYVEGWLGRFIDDAPDRARFEAALQRWLLAVLGPLPLTQVLASGRNELSHRLMQAGVDMGHRGVGVPARDT